MVNSWPGFRGGAGLRAFQGNRRRQSGHGRRQRRASAVRPMESCQTPGHLCLLIPSSWSSCGSTPFLWWQVAAWDRGKVPASQCTWGQPPGNKGWERMGKNTPSHPTHQLTVSKRPGGGLSVFHSCGPLGLPRFLTSASWSHLQN